LSCVTISAGSLDICSTAAPLTDERSSGPAQHDHRLLAVKPFAERQHDFEGFAPDNNDINASIEFFEAVRLLLTCTQEIERVVRSSKKAIDAYSAEN
jgi:hypothetical protein